MNVSLTKYGQIFCLLMCTVMFGITGCGGGNNNNPPSAPLDAALPPVNLACDPSPQIQQFCMEGSLENDGYQDCINVTCDYQKVADYCGVSNWQPDESVDGGIMATLTPTQQTCFMTTLPDVKFVRDCEGINDVTDLSTVPPPPQDKVNAVYQCFADAKAGKLQPAQ